MAAITVPGGATPAARRAPAMMVCSTCGVRGPCCVSRVTGAPQCRACVQRWRTCSRCGKPGHVLGGTLTEPLCPDCTSPATRVGCPACGRTHQVRFATCQGCNLRDRLVDLLGGGTATVRPGLEPLYDSLVNHARPATLLRWLARPHVTTALGDLGTGRLEPDHAAFDALPASKPVDHLRAMLVAVGIMPERDEHLARLQRWITDTISERPQARVLHRYAVWHLLRRLRNRTRGRHATAGQATLVRAQVTAAVTLLDWLNTRNLTLGTLGQADLDQWLAGQAANRITAGNFARWARQQKLTTLSYPSSGWNGPTGPIDTDARWLSASEIANQ